MSPKQQRGEETVTRLLDAALELYAAKGQDGFTVQALTAASGVSLGSLYHHFGSADGLAAALYARCMSDLLDRIIARLERTRTARTGVHAVVLAYLGFAEENPAAARFIHASSYASFLPAHLSLLAAAKTPRIERILAWFRPHVAAGRIVDLPEALAETLMIGPPAEFTRRWLSHAPGLHLAEAARVLPERVWRSLRA